MMAALPSGLISRVNYTTRRSPLSTRSMSRGRKTFRRRRSSSLCPLRVFRLRAT